VDPTPLEAGGVNAVGRMLGDLGDEWTLLIAQQAMLGARRYGDFVERLPISHAVLTTRLRTMIAARLLERQPYQSNPPRADYVLTPRGRALWPMLTSVWEWERHWVPDHHLPVMRHDACGAAFTPLLACRACSAPTSEKHLRVRWGASGSWQRSVPPRGTRRRSTSDGAGMFPETMSFLGNRWGFALLVTAFVGATRFGEFQAQLGAPPTVLADRLATFTRGGVLASSGGRYALTEKGRGVFAVLVTALQWAQRWYVAPEGPAVLLEHVPCGAPFEGVLTCDQCVVTLTGRSVRVRQPVTTDAADPHPGTA
jgi:DNA-binding HxlR family transcriptional regulator